MTDNLTGNLIARLFGRCQARRRYFTAADKARAACDRFLTATSAFARSQALRDEADTDLVMAANAFGFRGAAERDPDGCTLTDSHALAAELLDMVADTEDAVALNGLVTVRELQTMTRPWARLADDPAVAAVLTALSAESRPAARGVLTLALYDAVVPRVGGQAGEVLIGVAYRYFRLAGMSIEEATWRVGTKPNGGER